MRARMFYDNVFLVCLQRRVRSQEQTIAERDREIEEFREQVEVDARTIVALQAALAEKNRRIAEDDVQIDQLQQEVDQLRSYLGQFGADDSPARGGGAQGQGGDGASGSGGRGNGRGRGQRGGRGGASGGADEEATP